jgi:regulator of RNase E activity RraA
MVQFGCQANVFGMLVNDGEVIHADYHGAVVIPADAVTRLPAAIDLVARREKVILDIARAPGFTSFAMRTALKRAGEIH